jgi:ribosome silencing factor RsfS/YbeB/iojap
MMATISRPPARAALVKTVVDALEDMKAVNVKVMDVRKITDVSDCMVLACGNSDRHVRSIADRVVERAKAAGFRPMGMEGERDGEWVLVDLNDVIVHVMLPRVREFYALEELWEVAAAPVVKARAKSKAAGGKVPGGKAARARKSAAVRRAPGAKRAASSRKSGAASAARGKSKVKGKGAAAASRTARKPAPRGKKSAKGSARTRG